jgi:hypothetical protein
MLLQATPRIAQLQLLSSLSLHRSIQAWRPKDLGVCRAMAIDCPYHTYRQVYALLALWFKSQAHKADGPNRFVRIEAALLHKIMLQADVCQPFAAASGSNWDSASPSDQDDLHVQLPVPIGPRITSLQVQVTARDQGWCSDPKAGAWTWAELGWVNSEGQEQPPPAHGGGHDAAGVTGESTSQRQLVYTNAVNFSDWQTHDVSITGTQLQALLAARPRGATGLALWIRSRFPGWRHFVDRATLTMEWHGVEDDAAFVPILASRRTTHVRA